MPPNHDPLGEFLPDAAEWDLLLAGDVLPYVQESLRNGSTVAGRQIGIEPTLNVQNPKVAEWIARYTGLLANRVSETVREKIREALLAGLDEGISSRQMRHRVLEAFGCIRDEAGKIRADEALRYRSEMIARTETARAESSGFREQAKEAGITEVEWLSAPDACDWCAEMDGRIVAIDKPFFGRGDTFTIQDEEGAEHALHLNYADVEGPPLHPWCLLPHTVCEAPGGIVAGLRSWYNGPTVEMVCADGTWLAVTPNHMFMTPHGFIPADALSQGDYVFKCAVAPGVVPSYPYVDGQPTTIEQIFVALEESSRMPACRVPMAPEYLHGDAVFAKGQIDVVWADGFLGNGIIPGSEERRSRNLFDGRHDASALVAESLLAQELKALALTADSLVGGLRELPMLLWRAGYHHDAIGLGIGAQLYAHLHKAAANHAAPYAVSSRERILGFASLIAARDLFHRQLDSALRAGALSPLRLAEVRGGWYTGHVYDLQTHASVYTANTVVASNCRCALSVNTE